MEKVELNFYLVRNKEGKYFRSKGYGGYGENWVDNVLKARVYARIAGARTVVGYYAKNFPAFGIPDIIHLKATEFEVLNETERVTKAAAQRKKREEASNVRTKQYALKEAQKELEEAQERLDRVKEVYK